MPPSKNPSPNPVEERARLKAEREARAQTRLARASAGRKVTRETMLPGIGERAVLHILSSSESQLCYADALKRMKAIDLPYDSALLIEVFEDELRNQVLARACMDPDDPEKTLALDPEDLRDNTTVRERAAMFDAYNDFVLDVDPDPASLSAEDLADLLDAIKKKDRARLKQFGSAKLSAFMLSTAFPPSS